MCFNKLKANKCTKILINIFSAVLLLIFLAIFGVSIFGIVKYSGLKGVICGLLIASIIGLIISICGFFGAKYKNNKTGKYAPFLVTFFVGIIALCLVFVVFGAACFFMKNTISTLTLKSIKEVLNLFEGVFGSEENVQKILEKVQSYMDGIGIISMIVGAVLFVVIIITSIHMGSRLFSRV